MTIYGRPGIQPRSRDAGQSTPISRSWQRILPPAARLGAALAGLAVIATYLFIALSRLTYPFTVEWLESNSLVEVHRILAGQSLYPAPTAAYVPDGYPPLYFAVSAVVARVVGVSYLSLRLVSLAASVASFALLGRLVQRETGSAAAGIGAAGLFAAVYFNTQTWFDVGRVDSLFLALSLGGLYAARWMSRTRGAVAAGALLAAAALTKQTGLLEGIVVLAALVPGPRRRLALAAALTEFTVLGVSTLVLGLTSGGWYVYYVFEQMSEHALNDAAISGFWTGYLLPAMGIAGCAALIAVRRAPAVLVAGAVALAVEGYVALVHSGGGANDLLPAYLAVGLLAGLAMGDREPWWVGAVCAVLVLAQSAWLLSGFHPAQAIPTAADRAVGERFTAGLRTLGGVVAIPGDPGLSLLAGMAPAAHEDAAYDVLRGSDQTAITSFSDSVEHALAAGQYSALIFDSETLPEGYQPWLSLYYRQCPQPLLADVPAAEFRPVAGGVASRPTSIWLPLGRGSCPAAVSILSGSAKETP